MCIPPAVRCSLTVSRVRVWQRAANANIVDPFDVVDFAFKRTEVPGSSTVIVAALAGLNTLRVANVGDCGMRVYRRGELMYRSAPGEIEFNMPYQLGSPKYFPTLPPQVGNSVPPCLPPSLPASLPPSLPPFLPPSLPLLLSLLSLFALSFPLARTKQPSL